MATGCRLALDDVSMQKVDEALINNTDREWSETLT